MADRQEHALNRPGSDVTVMTYNLYLGADLTPVLLAESSTAFRSALRATLRRVAGTNFAARAQALAREIAAVGPDIFGLQEVVVWECHAAGDLPFDRSGVNLDFLAVLLHTLESLGAHYKAVVVGPGVAFGTPPGEDVIAAFTNRNVILMRDMSESDTTSISGSHAGTFATNIVVPSPQLGVVTITRGWAYAMVQLHGVQFCFVTVHLEDSHVGVQEAQAEELVQILREIDGPLVLVGDFNADAGSHPPTYTKLIAAGFRDGWEAAAPTTPGATCCQDEELRNAVSKLGRRIDWIMVRNAITVLDAFTAGNEEHSRTSEGLWPSDHAGVVARLHIG
ncbi:MAG: endonuclease/exonuclease/phosphatase family protein [Herpetosiphonaceae bacterium]|nr:endonuclease/exonuclease/phosphatase family protein [Herpetosiphonaceae bacterium]